MAPKDDGKKVGSLDETIARYEKLFGDAKRRQLIDERCEALLADNIGEDSFQADLEMIRSDSRFNVPAKLTPAKDAIARAILDEEFSRHAETAIADCIVWASKNPKASPAEIKSYYQKLHHLSDGKPEETDVEHYGLFRGWMPPTHRVLFKEAIKVILRKRRLSPLLFRWTEWQVMYRTENKRLRPYHDIFLGFTVVANLQDLKNFRLTQKDKKEIEDSAKDILGLRPNEHLPKALKKELEWLFAQSKGGSAKPSRKNIMLDIIDYEARDKLSLKEQEKAQRRDADRERQRRYRARLRKEKLIGKKLKK